MRRLLEESVKEGTAEQVKLSVWVIHNRAWRSERK